MITNFARQLLGVFVRGSPLSTDTVIPVTGDVTNVSCTDMIQEGEKNYPVIISLQQRKPICLGQHIGYKFDI